MRSYSAGRARYRPPFMERKPTLAHSQPLDRILSQLNPAYILMTCFLRVQVFIIVVTAFIFRYWSRLFRYFGGTEKQRVREGILINTGKRKTQTEIRIVFDGWGKITWEGMRDDGREIGQLCFTALVPLQSSVCPSVLVLFETCT